MIVADSALDLPEDYWKLDLKDLLGQVPRNPSSRMDSVSTGASTDGSTATEGSEGVSTIM